VVVAPLKGPLAGYIEEKYPKITVYTDVKDYQATLEAVLDGKAYAAALNYPDWGGPGRSLFGCSPFTPVESRLLVPIRIKPLSEENLQFC
jgi:hypothetical protein